MTLFDIAAMLIGLAALFGYLNHRFLKMPMAIGLVIIALLASLGLIALDLVVPSLAMGETLAAAVARVDFHAAVMEGMLSFLLFAGALHVDFEDLKSQGWAIGAMASAGVVISTLFVGTAMWLILDLLGLPVSWFYALVFGALISPTDPVAVLGILKTVKIPRSLEAKIAGESLFNDGVGVVVFLIMVALATGGSGHGGGGGEEVTLLSVAQLFAQEAVGGAILGVVGGYIAFIAMRSLDDYVLEVLITLALVMTGYALAMALHFSGPIMVVVAGLFIGNRGMKQAMSEVTRDHVKKFWTLLDEILNSVLFLLIGLEVLVLSFAMDHLVAGLIAIPVVLLGRLLAVAIPVSVLSLTGRSFTKGAVAMLTWGGLRGGISVALALSLPESEARSLILTVTYAVVLFSIIGQGLTVKTVAGKMVRSD